MQRNTTIEEITQQSVLYIDRTDCQMPRSKRSKLTMQ